LSLLMGGKKRAGENQGLVKYKFWRRVRSPMFEISGSGKVCPVGKPGIEKRKIADFVPSLSKIAGVRSRKGHKPGGRRFKPLRI